MIIKLYKKSSASVVLPKGTLHVRPLQCERSCAERYKVVQLAGRTFFLLK